jgi:hypothetical protein
MESLGTAESNRLKPVARGSMACHVLYTIKRALEIISKILKSLRDIKEKMKESTLWRGASSV